MTDREVMQQALEALNLSAVTVDSFGVQQAAQDAITAIRTALEQQAEPVSGCACRWDHEDNRVVTCERHQGWLDVIAEWADRAREAEAKLKAVPPKQQAEPVAWQYKKVDAGLFVSDQHPLDVEVWNDIEWSKPLYTSPPQRQWVGLTAQEIQAIHDTYYRRMGRMEFAQHIEAKLKEKNSD